MRAVTVGGIGSRIYEPGAFLDESGEVVRDRSGEPDVSFLVPHGDGRRRVDRSVTEMASSITDLRSVHSVSFDGGDGSKRNPYRIATAEQLSAIREDVAAHYELVSDVDAGSLGEFEPVPFFRGSLEGNDHVVSGLEIDRPKLGDPVDGSVVSVVDVEVYEPTRVEPTLRSTVSILLDEITIVYPTEEGTERITHERILHPELRADHDHVVDLSPDLSAPFDESRADETRVVDASGMDVVASGRQIGLIGSLGDSARVANLELVDVDVTGTTEVGGVVGYAAGTVVGCSVSGTVTGHDLVGGLVGVLGPRGSVADCSAATTVSDVTFIGGGLVGTVNGEVRRSSASGSVEGEIDVAGLAGQAVGTSSDTAEVAVAYSTATVTARGERGAAGFVGVSFDTNHRQTYVSGSISGASEASDAFSKHHSNGAVTACYWDAQATGLDAAALPPENGLTTAEMTGEAPREHMAGFEFGSEWTTTDSYPALVGSGSDPGGGGSPPVADFDVSPRVVTTEQGVSFTASPTTGSVDSFEWEFGDGESTTGERVSHTYAAPGEFSVELTAVGPGGSDTVTKSLGVVDGPTFEVFPPNPTTADLVEFLANGSDDGFTWKIVEDVFGRTQGETIVHSFEEAGEYVVQMVPDFLDPDEFDPADAVDKTVEIQPASIEIANVVASPPTLLEGIDSPLSLNIDLDVATGTDVGSVTVEYGGRTRTASEVDRELDIGQYYVEIPPSERDLSLGPNEFEIVATSADGSQTDTRTVNVPVMARGPNLDRILVDPVVDGTGIDFHHDYFYLDETITTDHEWVPDNLPFSNLTILDATATFGIDGTLNLGTGGVTAGSDAVGGIKILGVGLEVQAGYGFESQVTDYQRDLEITRFRLAGTGSPRSGRKLEIQPPDWTGQDAIEVDLEVRPGINVLAESFQSLTPNGAPFLPRDGFFDTHNNLSAGTATSRRGVDVELSLSGYFHTAAKMDLARVIVSPALVLEPEGGIARIDGSIAFTLGPFDEEGSLSDVLPNDTAVATGTVRDEPDWEVFDGSDVVSQAVSAAAGTTDATDPELADPTGPNPPDGALVAATGDAVVSRWTDRETIDTAPAVARFGDGHVAVWEAHRSGAPADAGRDVAVATRLDDGWTDRTYLTNATGQSHHAPTIATDGSRAVAAWERIDVAAVDDLANVDAHTTLDLMVHDGTQWRAPTTLADGDVRSPTVASFGELDRWVVAWETGSEDPPSIRYAVIEGDAEVVREETVRDATRPIAVSDGDGAVLVYHDPEAGQVVRDRLTSAGRSRIERYDVSRPVDLAAAGSAVAWTVVDGETASIRYATDGTIETVPAADDRRTIEDLGVVETSAGRVLTFRRNVTGDPLGGYAAMIVRDGEWLPERVVARTGGGVPVTAWKPTVAPKADGDGIVAFLAAKVRDGDGVEDLFEVDQTFEPAYRLATSPATPGVAPGDDVEIAYALRNDGPVAGTDPIPIEARSGGRTLGHDRADPPEPGDSTTGTVTTTLDATGTVRLVAGPNHPDTPSGGLTETVVVSTPSLQVGGVSVSRSAARRATATIDLVNAGPIDAGEFGVRVEDGDTLVGTADVDGVPADSSTSVEVSFDPSVLDRSTPETVRIDPDGTLPPSHVASPVESVLLGRPSLTFAGDVTYRIANGRVTATVSLTNSGPVDTEATIVAVPAGTTPTAGGFTAADTLGEAVATVPASVDGLLEGVDVVVPLGSIDDGDAVTFVVQTVRATADPGIPILRDEVGPIFESPGTGGIEQYANDRGIVTTAGLVRAITDWSEGEIDTLLLTRIIQAWSTGSPVT